MKKDEFCFLMATIYLSPHLPAGVGYTMALVFIGFAVLWMNTKTKTIV